ncbi:SDR family NAD(P)-dependent oxidoreductase [Actinomadura terrae]|uniref:SDR family NAD(P)-dependent oxidoreductase n=1 Tax=Actinomadura terrae TaxID=604353 RepID=UPI001FA7968B|nr:SDR family oxidoreductase [Actinomadura terrae]
MSIAYDFTEKVALVTGGGHGVGAYIAADLGASGAHVVVNYCRDTARAQATCKQIIADGGSAERIRANVSHPQAVTDMFEAVRERHGRLDILVNNAATGVVTAMGTVKDKQMNRVIGTNLLGPLRCSQEAARLMPPGSAIVNLSSFGAMFALPWYSAVGPIKAAVESLTRYLAVDFSELGIRVNAASMGPIDSEAVRGLPGFDQLASAVIACTPLGRLGGPAEIANLVMFLASPEASWINGQTVLADGGLTIAAPGIPFHLQPRQQPVQP